MYRYRQSIRDEEVFSVVFCHDIRVDIPFSSKWCSIAERCYYEKNQEALWTNIIIKLNVNIPWSILYRKWPSITGIYVHILELFIDAFAFFLLKWFYYIRNSKKHIGLEVINILYLDCKPGFIDIIWVFNKRSFWVRVNAWSVKFLRYYVIGSKEDLSWYITF